MSDQEPSIVESNESSNGAGISSQPLNRRYFIIAAVVAVLLILGVAGRLLTKSKGESDTAAMADKNKTAQAPSSAQSNGDSRQIDSLAANICPDIIFTENGATRGDYQGKPYAISAESASWIQQNCGGKTSGVTPGSSSKASSLESEPPLKLKSIGFNLDTYNAASGMAGDIKFTKTPLPFNQIVSPFGQQDPRTTDTTKRNVQPTFILPLGSKVKSLVDGEVVEIKDLYSGDVTIWVAKSKDSSWYYETEHVMNPVVKKGDTVKAGQVIAEVSNYDSKNNPGFGLFEIGIFHPASSGEPEHLCPFKYMDPTIEQDINAKLTSLYSSWESYLGKNIYDQEKYATPGCVVEEPVKG
jgi:murein DD-endopeptidase MepM/ murein hydrolase activator NlpD